MLRILAASGGMLAVSRLPVLPALPQPAWLALILLGAAIILLWRFPHGRWLASFGLGAIWAVIAGHHILAQQLPGELEGEELLISGYVSDLPENREDFQRFEFTVSDYHNLKPAYAREQVLPKRVMLSWYGQQSLRVAQQWTLRVKLSRPRGFVNSGGFDYQRWLLSRGLGATGYVRPSTHNEMQGLAPGYLLPKRREAIRDWISREYDAQTAGLLLALAIGDTSGITVQQWDLLRSTGTSHLMAISGLHIGLIAALGYWLGHGTRAGVSLLRVSLGFAYWLPGMISCALAALYSAMAGFALPTQRALTMVVLVNIALLAARSGSSMRALAWAMLIVLIVDPLAGYELGFWLSFGAVACLLFHFQCRYQAPPLDDHPKAGRRLAVFGRAQWVVFLGLMVPLLVLNQPLSLLTPLANIVVIPLVSLFVVAPLLAGVLFNWLGMAVAGPLVACAAWVLKGCLLFLEWLLRHLQVAAWYPEGAAWSWFAVLAAAAGVLLLLSPRGLPARWLSVLLVAPLLLPRAADRPPLEVTILDVGQGLAAVLRTENRTLVYDTGPIFSERFNAGDAILAPHLRARGIHHVDRLILSHGDGDHAGGAAALMAEVDVAELVIGHALPDIARDYPEVPASICDKGDSWQWDDVHFELIEPLEPGGGSTNDQSCILAVEYAGQRVLIPGDIEAGMERTLLKHSQLEPDIQLLVAPHHGSATSSTNALVEHLSPEHVVYSTAYRSPYGHPHPDVQARYRSVGSSAHNSGHSGQLTFVWDREGTLRVESLRAVRRRYWFDGF